METHDNVLAKRDLSAAQLAERSVAARARWAGHRAETNPTVRQAAWGEATPPSKSAVSLFRQGMPSSGRSGGLWDTRSVEPSAGQIRGRLTFHFPRAYRSDKPDAPLKHEKKLLAHRLAADPAQPVAITNPGTIAEAQRHPEMRALMQGAVETVRQNQKGAIAKATEDGIIPEGTPPGLVREAYKHAALLALHKAGLVDWAFEMDAHAKKAFKPLVPFMRYASRRVFDQLNVQHKGKWTAFRDEFGEEFKDRRKDAAGKVRRRMRPNQEFVKVDQAWGELAKAFDATKHPRGQGGKFSRSGTFDDAIRGAQLSGGAVGGIATGHLISSPRAARHLTAAVDKVGKKIGNAAEARFRLASRKAGAYTSPHAEQVLRSQGRLLNGAARLAGKGLGRAGIATAAFAAGDYAGDLVGRKVFGQHGSKKHYRHFNALGFGLGSAGAVGAHLLARARFARKLVRRFPLSGRAKLLASGIALTAGLEGAGTHIQDRGEEAIGKLAKMTLADLGLDIGKAPSPGQPLPGGVQSGWLAGRLALARKESQGQRAMKILTQKQKMERHFAANAERVKDLEHAPTIKQGMLGSTRGYDLKREGMSQPGLGLGGAMGTRIGSASRVGQGMRIGSTQRVGSVDRISPGLRLGQTAKFGVKQKIGTTARFGVTQRLSPFQRVEPVGPLRKDTIGGQMVMQRATHLGNIRPIAAPHYQNKKIQYHANPTFARPGSIQRFVNSITGVNSAAMLPGPARSFRKPRRFTSHSATSTYGGAYASSGTPTQGGAQISVQTPNPSLYQKLEPIEEAIALRKAIQDVERRAAVRQTMHEFKHGKLRSGSKKGPRVTNRRQAVAIAISQAERLGKRVPAKFLAGAAVGAGAALFGQHAKESYDESSPATHAMAGAATGLGAAYLLGRTRARYAARREASRIFHAGLDAARTHLGATGDRSAFRTAKHAAVQTARKHRDEARAAWRPRKSHLAIGAATGATAALPSRDQENT
jgi:hypothetical protein